MSAWIVSEKHVLTLAYFYEKMVKDSLKDGTPANMDNIKNTARVLWAENTKSVNCRYGEHFKMRFTNSELPDFKISMEALSKQIWCWEYQTCEHVGHEKSKAWKMMLELQKAILYHVMVKQHPHAKQYEDAKWGI